MDNPSPKFYSVVVDPDGGSLVAQEVSEAVTKSVASPLIFISHDSRDAELAEAFSRLLRAVSAGMLKSFRSSDKKGNEGIEFGDEWFKRLMEKLDTASDVVCLLTERSLDRPWILFEAGVAKGKFGSSVQATVQGVALGISLSRVSASGPFYQFQNNDGSEDGLVKLVLQLCRRIPGSEPDEGIVRAQVGEFRKAVDTFLEKIDAEAPPQDEDEVAGAKVVEEMKLMVRELSARMDEGLERSRFKRFRRVHPMALMELSHMISRGDDDPTGILVMASAIREDAPWLYELARDVYSSLKLGDSKDASERLRVMHRAVDMTLHGPLSETLGKEAHMAIHEITRGLHHLIERQIERVNKKKKPIKRVRSTSTTETH
jgi:hypothetical protein